MNKNNHTVSEPSQKQEKTVTKQTPPTAPETTTEDSFCDTCYVHYPKDETATETPTVPK